MNCKKHLNKKITNILFIIGFLVLYACSKESKKEDFIARVNQSYLTREELTSLVDTSYLTSVQREQIIKNWVYNEILFQEAQRQGITENDDYINIIKKSSRELAAAMILESYALSEQVEYNEDELKKYYQNNKNYFRVGIDSYLINRVSFDNEDKAIKFRSLVFDNNWEKAVKVFSSDSSLNLNLKSVLVDDNNIYPNQFERIIKDIFPEEISIVITEKPGYYSVVQLLAKYPKESIPPFEVMRSKVEKRFAAEKKNKLIEDYLKELYSNNDVEIKK
jgi:hypothetical protein